MSTENSIVKDLLFGVRVVVDAGAVLFAFGAFVYATVASLASWPLVPNLIWFCVAIVFMRSTVRWLGDLLEEFDL